MTWLAVGNIAVKPLWFLFTTAVCIRILGPTEYGQFVATLALAMIVAAFSDWGLSDYAVGETSRWTGTASSLFSTLTALRVVLALVALIATLGVGVALGRSGHGLYMLTAAAAYTGAFRLLEYIRSYYRSCQILRYEAVSIVAERSATIAGGVAGIALMPDAVGVLSGMAVGTTAALVGNVVWIHRNLLRFDAGLISWAASWTALASAFPLGLYGFLSILFLNTGTVILEGVSGADAAGQFGAAYRFVEVAALLPSVVVAAVYPRLSMLHAARDKSFWTLLVRSTGVATAVAAVAAVFLSAFGPSLLSFVAGQGNVIEARGLMTLIVWQIPLMTASGVLGVGLMASGNARTLAAVLLVVVPVNILLNVALVPSFSYVGTASSLLIGQSVAVALFAWRLAHFYSSSNESD